MSLYVKESDMEPVLFDQYRFIPLLDQKNGCQAGCHCGILEYIGSFYDNVQCLL